MKEYPQVLKCIPLLLAVRGHEIYAIDGDGEYLFNFKKVNYSLNEYKAFMRKTGLFTLISEHIINNLVDYVTGVEVGLDSNGRKNRGGHLMEDLVESYLQKSGLVKNVDYFKEMRLSAIEAKWNIDLSSISNQGKAEKRFDFVVKRDSMIYGIETNFYTGGGSKLNETATFFHFRGSNAAFSPKDIDLDSLPVKMLHFGYILLMDAFDAPSGKNGTVLADFLEEAQKRGIQTSVDVVSDSLGQYREKVVPALRFTDNAIVNEIEACGTAGLPPRDGEGRLIPENIRKALDFFMQCGVGERVIIHCPEMGFCLDAQGKYTEVPSLALPKGYIKGTVGAGDAFCAGALYGIYNGFTDREILSFAAGSAACNLSAMDSVGGRRSRDEIWDVIRNYEVKV